MIKLLLLSAPRASRSRRSPWLDKSGAPTLGRRKERTGMAKKEGGKEGVGGREELKRREERRARKEGRARKEARMEARKEAIDKPPAQLTPPV